MTMIFDQPSQGHRVLITGAEGYIGRLLTEALHAQGDMECIVAVDVRETSRPLSGVVHERVDITEEEAVSEVVGKHRPDTVVHLAAVVTPQPGQGREQQHAVDVQGTRHLLDACLRHGVSKLVYTSSGAAYGYHADNPCRLDESDALRGNEAFAYAWHKKLVEEMLAEYRTEHPELKQLVFRVSTILGKQVRNQITALFERPIILGLRDVGTPFCFIWDEDVVAALSKGVCEQDSEGVFNLTADGVMTLREIAQEMGRPFFSIPAWVLRGSLEVLSELAVAPYGPEQVMFLEHRPVLANDALVGQFGFVPRKNSREVFDVYRSNALL